MSRLLREPLLHFAVLGAALFVGYSLLQRERGDDASSQEIHLGLDDLAQLQLLFESKWQRPPTAEEFELLVEDRIREEILYREALALGLDENDTIVRRRMAQKMKFLAEDLAAAREPTDAELRAWFAENGQIFALPGRVSFRHLYFSNDRRDGRARQDAAAALAELDGAPQDPERLASLADPFMFQDYYGDRTVAEIAREFGPGFAEAVVALTPGSWQGPLESGYGWHLVFVDSVTPGRIPTFEEVEPEVKTAWLGEQKAQAWQKAYAELRARYTVLMAAPPETGATP